MIRSLSFIKSCTNVWIDPARYFLRVCKNTWGFPFLYFPERIQMLGNTLAALLIFPNNWSSFPSTVFQTKCFFCIIKHFEYHFFNFRVNKYMLRHLYFVLNVFVVGIVYPKSLKCHRPAALVFSCSIAEFCEFCVDVLNGNWGNFGHILESRGTIWNAMHCVFLAIWQIKSSWDVFEKLSHCLRKKFSNWTSLRGPSKATSPYLCSKFFANNFFVAVAGRKITIVRLTG